MTHSKNRPRQRRLFVAPPLAQGAHTLQDSAAHYVGRVLRLAVGTPLTLFDGQGHEADAVIERMTKTTVELVVGEPLFQAPPPLNLTVALATPKGERADWAVEKLTEVGVSTVHWLKCERSVAIAERNGKRAERWQRIAEAAAGQCGRAHVPALDGPTPISAFVQGLQRGLKLLAHPGERSLPELLASHAEPLSGATIVIGPEGGFSDAELLLSRQAGYNHCAVGPYAMRIETAAVVASGLLLGSMAPTRVAPSYNGRAHL